MFWSDKPKQGQSGDSHWFWRQPGGHQTRRGDEAGPGQPGESLGQR